MDDLLDLNFASPPKPSASSSSSGGAKNIQRTLNGTPIGANQGKKPDAFDFLLNGSGPSVTAQAGPTRPVSGAAVPKALSGQDGFGQGMSGSRNGSSANGSLSGVMRFDQPLRTSSGLASGFGDLHSPHSTGNATSRTSTQSSGPTSSVAPRAGPSGSNGTSTTTTSSKSDAFQDLFALSGTASSSTQKQSLADRQAQMEREKREKEERERQQFNFDGGFLDGLGGGPSAASNGGSFARSISPALAPTPAAAPKILKPLPQHAKPAGKGSFWDSQFASAGASSSSATSSTGRLPKTGNGGGMTATDRWDTPPVKRVGSSVAPPDDPFDFDALARATPGIAGSSGSESRSGIGGLEDDDDDFLGQLGKPVSQARTMESGHGQRTGDGFDEDDDDLLGELGRPAHARKQATTSNQARSPPTHSPAHKLAKPNRASSPPPHIIGQIVEMGYSPAQARQALAATADGLDVQGAVEILLSGIVGGAGGSAGRESESGGHARRSSLAGREDDDDDADNDDEHIERERQQRLDRERDQAEAERRRARRAGPSRSSIQPRSAETRQCERNDDDILASDSYPRGGPSGAGAGGDADKYIQQATAIGSSMLGKASNLWAAGKERAAKLYEEQKRNYEAQQRALAERERGGDERGGSWRGMEQRDRGDGRPRWMVDAQYEAGEGEERVSRSGTGAGFRDSDDEGPSGASSGSALPPYPSEMGKGSGGRAELDRRRDVQERPQGDTYRSVKERADSLFADPPRNYVPAHRRKAQPTPSSDAVRNGTSTPSRPASRPAPMPARAATPLIKRSIPTAPSAALAAANASKTKGNDHFKLGRFAEAETAYTASISRLPPGHLVLIALYNNRATARLKLGEWSGAVDDCSAALEIIGQGYHPSKEDPLPPTGADTADVKLAEGMVKAYTKRAQAREMGEKWKEALEDWEKVVALCADGAFQAGHGSKGALEGVRRARKMLNPSTAPIAAYSTSSVPEPEGWVMVGSNSGSATSQNRPTAPIKSKAAASFTGGTTKASAHMTTENSHGVSQIRAAAQAAAKENDARLAVQDAVDAKITAWKGGKETNLRALIASLDTVLWAGVMVPAQGGATLKVGMHELISEKQVKVRYMRVVSRLHPDKLDTTNTTVEQRMIANAVFGALSEAWQAFQNGS